MTDHDLTYETDDDKLTRVVIYACESGSFSANCCALSVVLDELVPESTAQIDELVESAALDWDPGYYRVAAGFPDDSAAATLWLFDVIVPDPLTVERAL